MNVFKEKALWYIEMVEILVRQLERLLPLPTLSAIKVSNPVKGMHVLDLIKKNSTNQYFELYKSIRAAPLLLYWRVGGDGVGLNQSSR